MAKSDKGTQLPNSLSSRVGFGFDYRRLPIWQQLPVENQAEFRPSDLIAVETYPTTLSEGVWPSVVDETLVAKRNGAELFDVDTFLALNAPDPKQACAVAFDVAWNDIEISSAKGWFKPTPVSSTSNYFEWRAAGYDVADCWLQFSALYGFSWNDDILSVTADPEIKLNRSGVFDNITSARHAIKHFERLAPEHAPYFVCGVWIGRHK